MDERARTISVRVDADLCIGNAMCMAEAPGAFAADANGQAVVTNPDAEAVENVLAAAAMCPVGAIAVEDAQTGRTLEPPR